jgi:hypothetical protein
MHRITPTTPRRRARSVPCQLIITLALFLLLIAAGPVAASLALPALTSVAPWSARCYTDTCVGFRLIFDGGHTAALGHAGDNPDHWAIFDGDDLTADEATFIEATVSALERHNLPALVVAYPEIPDWYMDSLAAYMVPTPPLYRLLLPLLRR